MGMLETQYLSLMTLDNFRYTSSDTARFRCPICGDVSAGGTGMLLSMNDDNPTFYCHRRMCSIPDGNSFSNFLKEVDPRLYEQYSREKWEVWRKSKRTEKKKIVIKDDRRATNLKVLDTYLKTVHSSEEATNYLTKRKIGEEHWDKLYYFVGNPYDLFNKVFGNQYEMTPGRKNSNIIGILCPVIDHSDKVQGFSIRNLDNRSPQRFVNLMLKGNPVFYGEDDTSPEKNLIVCEGLMDRLSLSKKHNVVAMMSTNTKMERAPRLTRESVIYCFDFEENSAIRRNMEKVLKAGHKVFVWDNTYNGAKDFNDLKTKYNLTSDQIYDYIMCNVCGEFNTALNKAYTSLNISTQRKYAR